MIISCARCGKKINSPQAANADYIIASDMVVREPREVLVALKQNQTTLTKKQKGEAILDSDYDAVEVPDVSIAEAMGEDLFEVRVEVREKAIQKTGVICPDCYEDTDFVIWGVHKQVGSQSK